MAGSCFLCGMAGLRRVYFFLEKVEEAGGVGAVHLCVVELERYGEGGFEPASAVSAPYHEGVVEDAAVHAHGAVDVELRERGCAYHHAVGEVVVAACFGHLGCEAEVVGVECGKVGRKRYVAGTYFAVFIGYDGVDGYFVEQEEFVADGKHVEFLDLGGGFSDAPAHEHVEFQAFFTACFCDARHVECLDECDHGHGRFHPRLEGEGACGVGRVYLFHVFWALAAMSVICFMNGDLAWV